MRGAARFGQAKGLMDMEEEAIPQDSFTETYAV